MHNSEDSNEALTWSIIGGPMLHGGADLREEGTVINTVPAAGLAWWDLGGAGPRICVSALYNRRSVIVGQFDTGGNRTAVEVWNEFLSGRTRKGYGRPVSCVRAGELDIQAKSGEVPDRAFNAARSG